MAGRKEISRGKYIPKGRVAAESGTPHCCTAELIGNAAAFRTSRPAGWLPACPRSHFCYRTHSLFVSAASSTAFQRLPHLPHRPQYHVRGAARVRQARRARVRARDHRSPAGARAAVGAERRARALCGHLGRAKYLAQSRGCAPLRLVFRLQLAGLLLLFRILFFSIFRLLCCTHSGIFSTLSLCASAAAVEFAEIFWDPTQLVRSHRNHPHCVQFAVFACSIISSLSRFAANFTDPTSRSTHRAILVSLKNTCVRTRTPQQSFRIKCLSKNGLFVSDKFVAVDASERLLHKSRITLSDAHAFFLLPTIDVTSAATASASSTSTGATTAADAAATDAGSSESAHAIAVSSAHAPAPPMASFATVAAPIPHLQHLQQHLQNQFQQQQQQHMEASHASDGSSHNALNDATLTSSSAAQMHAALQHQLQQQHQQQLLQQQQQQQLDYQRQQELLHQLQLQQQLQAQHEAASASVHADAMNV